MMSLKRKTWILIFLAGVTLLVWLGICLFQSRSPHATVTWSYDYRANPACEKLRTTGCVDHFEVYDITGGPKLLQRLDNPPQSFGDAEISTTFLLQPPYGMRTIAVVAVGRDSSGAAASSSLSAANVDLMAAPHQPRSCFGLPGSLQLATAHSSAGRLVQWGKTLRSWVIRAREKVSKRFVSGMVLAL